MRYLKHHLKHHLKRHLERPLGGRLRPHRPLIGRNLTRGFTLVELMITITVAGLLAAVAAPQFSDYLNNSRLREGGTTLQTEALFAQSEAIKRNRIVRLSTSGATVQVLEAQNAAATTLLRERTLAGGVTAATSTVDFSPRGYTVNRAVAPSVDFAASDIDLALTGATCTNDTRCPRLRVEGGGGIRLCGNKLVAC